MSDVYSDIEKSLLKIQMETNEPRIGLISRI